VVTRARKGSFDSFQAQSRSNREFQKIKDMHGILQEWVSCLREDMKDKLYPDLVSVAGSESVAEAEEPEEEQEPSS
jgi:hypothetical protein